MDILTSIQDFLNLVLANPLTWLLYLVAVLVALIVIRKLWGGLRRRLRRSRAPRIHPNLEKYSVDYAEVSRQRKELAVGIIATSTSNRLHGYRVVRQVDAVFVDGCRTPEEAMIALKASAAERGGNAIINVATERSSTGKCSASGDAILAAEMLQRPERKPTQPPSSQ